MAAGVLGLVGRGLSLVPVRVASSRVRRRALVRSLGTTLPVVDDLVVALPYKGVLYDLREEAP